MVREPSPAHRHDRVDAVRGEAPGTRSSVRSTSATVPSGCLTGYLRGFPAFVVPMIVPHEVGDAVDTLSGVAG